MKFKSKPANSGIALIMVMLIVVVLGALAARFAYHMKVETKLARNASVDADMEWLGRSGIELARYILAQEGLVPGGGQVDSLKQYWAGGPGETNGILTELTWPWKLGIGEIERPKIIDCDRKFNINVADEVVLRQALTLVGVDAGSFPTIVDSILDWRDPEPDLVKEGPIGLQLHSEKKAQEIHWKGLVLTTFPAEDRLVTVK